MSELNKLTIREAYQGLRDKKFSSEDLVNACLTATSFSYIMACMHEQVNFY